MHHNLTVHWPGCLSEILLNAAESTDGPPEDLLTSFWKWETMGANFFVAKHCVHDIPFNALIALISIVHA